MGDLFNVCWDWLTRTDDELPSRCQHQVRVGLRHQRDLHLVLDSRDATFSDAFYVSTKHPSVGTFLLKRNTWSTFRKHVRRMMPQGFENAWNTYVGSSGSGGGGGSSASGQTGSSGSSSSSNSYGTTRFQNGWNNQGVGGSDHHRREINNST